MSASLRVFLFVAHVVLGYACLILSSLAYDADMGMLPYLCLIPFVMSAATAVREYPLVLSIMRSR